MFYEFNVMMKYMTVVLAGLMFIITTNPGEFAASHNKIGFSYKIGYSVAIVLHYIPDVQDDFVKSKHAQEARGIEMSAKASLLDIVFAVVAMVITFSNGSRFYNPFM